MSCSVSDQERVLFLLRELCNQFGPKFERNTNMSLSRYELLHQLFQTDEMTQSTLQKSVNIDNAAITRHLKQLESQGMVARRRNPSDHRETFVSLTSEGREQILGCSAEKRCFVDQMLQGFSPEELRALTGMLTRIQSNISKY
ncbi:MarR family transcriptional regulator [Paenibacillus sp. FSL W8-0186]|uniref:HTH-type transcriptional regulator YdgJ n=1 Tax=Paenibacillus woosongensis TaxID=307580 RepID=A0ABQ4MMD9_9BACL|nr:MarR family transcriptional regulator [Paenibacillus woosongensis]GIP57171.1 putative HTH-type transcriptional regulator YdgJ [Paenibacillus woosongensis]